MSTSRKQKPPNPSGSRNARDIAEAGEATAAGAAEQQQHGEWTSMCCIYEGGVRLLELLRRQDASGFHVLSIPLFSHKSIQMGARAVDAIGRVITSDHWCIVEHAHLHQRHKISTIESLNQGSIALGTASPPYALRRVLDAVLDNLRHAPLSRTGLTARASLIALVGQRLVHGWLRDYHQLPELTASPSDKPLLDLHNLIRWATVSAERIRAEEWNDRHAMICCVQVALLARLARTMLLKPSLGVTSREARSVLNQITNELETGPPPAPLLLATAVPASQVQFHTADEMDALSGTKAHAASASNQSDIWLPASWYRARNKVFSADSLRMAAKRGKILVRHGRLNTYQLESVIRYRPDLRDCLMAAAASSLDDRSSDDADSEPSRRLLFEFVPILDHRQKPRRSRAGGRSE